MILDSDSPPIDSIKFMEKDFYKHNNLSPVIDITKKKKSRRDM
jgi:hypothetical protein